MARKIQTEELAGPDALRVWRARYRVSQSRLSELLGMGRSASNISDFERGAAGPNVTTAAAIELLTGGAVPAVSWADASKLSKVSQEFVEKNAERDQASVTAGRRRRRAA